MTTSEISWQKMQVERLFAAFDRTPSPTQIAEWNEAMGRFRVDDATNAVGSLIATVQKLPTISQFRAEAMKHYTARRSETSDWDIPKAVQAINKQAEIENRQYWNDRFGPTAGDTARKLIGELCVVAKSQRKTAEMLAGLLNLKIDADERMAKLVDAAGTIEIADERELKKRLVHAGNDSQLLTSERLLMKKTIDAYLQGW